MRSDTIRSERTVPHSVAHWLFLCAAMVLAMMIIGAITRLTESGLSMVEWRPLIGVLPPMNDAEWDRVFALYRETPEYRIANAGMTLAEFQTIFWWEFIHRLWGRSIGLVFAVPFVVFLIRGMIPRGLIPHLVALFVLGGLQGVIGWWMVKSGFVDRTDVSQYRLAVHLALAFIILGYLLWVALDIVAPRNREPSPLRGHAMAVLAVIFVTAFAGGLVAGLRAGLDYNTWPLMGDSFVPDGLLSMSPVWLNVFENIATVQFDHRMLAYLSAVLVASLWWRGRNADPLFRSAVTALAHMTVLQIGLGIATLLLVVPLPLAVLHQAGAAVTFSLAVWALHAASGRG
ncbi:MAG: COX15/CtaA family protein [Alphaproteobacteria bacterium]